MTLLRSRKRRWTALLPVIALFSLHAATAADAVERNATWAKPIPLEGASNLFQVSDTLYRSAQPTPDGLKHLKELGIKTVINLRAFHNDRSAAKAAELLNEELSINTWNIEDDDVIKVLTLLKDPAGAPYLIHCQHGADRTGVMVAMYRIVYQHWTRNEAIDELVHGGYGFHSLWSNITEYLRHVDITVINGKLPH